MLTTNDIADKMRVSPRTVRNWIERGELPAYQAGKDYRIDEEDFEKYLESIRTKSEIRKPNYNLKENVNNG